MSMATKGAADSPPGYVPHFDHPQDVIHTLSLVTVVLAIVMVTVFVMFRLCIRLFVAGGNYRDDPTCLATCVIAWALSCGYFSTAIPMALHGGGSNEWEVIQEDRIQFNKAVYVDTIVYGPAAFFTKATILLLFARVFSPFRKTVIFIYVFMVCMLLYYIPIMGIKIGICNPIAGQWDKSIPAKCIDERQVFKTDTVASVGTDLVVLILPVVLTRSLRISMEKKLKIMALLAAGGLAAVSSVVRLVLVFQPNSFDNITITFVRFNLLAVAELTIALSCACIPSIAAFFARKKAAKEEAGKQNSNSVRLSTRWTSTFVSELKRPIANKTRSTFLDSDSGTYMELEWGKNMVANNSISPTKSSHSRFSLPIEGTQEREEFRDRTRRHWSQGGADRETRLWGEPWDGSQFERILRFQDAHMGTRVSLDGRIVVAPLQPIPPIPRLPPLYNPMYTVPLSTPNHGRKAGSDNPW
ncbi:hypothetical protein HYFRA_00001202 [Hymenoscyphus fraxineus]|uniref:Rhodopsin domain-containing protein n=1 Tax=Hymenoscyphus fraxineus TaxID=746836 RepID=A0A9N9KUN1_9HELO|nr:hypothetical protein HYFRA_00001202 [Hymenoscyphus fraxineus]